MLIVLLIFILLCLPFILYYIWVIKQRNLFNNKRSLFESLIYDYSLNRKRMTDEDVSFYISSFKLNDILLTPEDLGLNSERGTWESDSETMGTLINIVHSLMVRTINPKDSLYKDEKIWGIVKHTIRTMASRLPTKPIDNTFTWGTNWYQFSITYPLFLVSSTYMHRRLFKSNDEFVTRHLSSYIANYFSDPKTVTEGMKSIGWTRDGPNAVMMAVPYTGGHLFMRDWSEKATSMQYVKNYVTLNFVTSGNGFYANDTFIYHSSRDADGSMVGLRALGYLTSAYGDFVLMSNFFGMPNVVNAIHSILSKTEHPTIPLHNGCWFTRRPNMSSEFSRF